MKKTCCHFQTNYLTSSVGAKQECTIKERSLFRQLVTVKVFTLTFTNLMQESCKKSRECARDETQ
jgi:hypothetical protein